MWADEIAPGWKLAGTFCLGAQIRRSTIMASASRDDAYVAEASLKNGPWTAFARGEITENRELLELGEGEHGSAFTVGKVSLGAVRDFKVADHFALGVGGLVAVEFRAERSFATNMAAAIRSARWAFVRLKVE